MTILMWVVGTVLVQTVIGMFVARCIRTGKGPSYLEVEKLAADGPRAYSANDAVESSTNLAALMRALALPSEQALTREAGARESVLPAAAADPKMPGHDWTRTSAREANGPS
jgi:hypothetical protein